MNQPLPAYIDREAWDEYTTMRARIKKPMTPRVIRQKLALLQRFKDRGYDVNEVIDAATNGHWLDFYAPREVEIPHKASSQADKTTAYLAELSARPLADPARVMSLVARVKGKAA